MESGYPALLKTNLEKLMCLVVNSNCSCFNLLKAEGETWTNKKEMIKYKNGQFLPSLRAQ